ncbi:central domain of glycogen debranching enzyme-domain-containing protein [Mycena olivaceomarginata]|nr:central domain of glycogen debranching enzyme-domain-containing protein [Mycena olivaceomarginata]
MVLCRCWTGQRLAFMHLEMLGRYQEGHVHRENDYIVLHRAQPGRLFTSRAHRVFQGLEGPQIQYAFRCFILSPYRQLVLIVILLVDPIKLRCTRVKFILGAGLDIASYNVPKDAHTLQGILAKLVELEPLVVPQGLNGEGPHSEILVPEYFPPGSIMLFKTHLHGYDASLDAFCAKEALADLDLIDLNVLLHRADGDERDASNGEFGVYDVPGLGKTALWVGRVDASAPGYHVL